MAGFDDGSERAGWPTPRFLAAVTASPLVQEAVRSAKSVAIGSTLSPAADPISAVERGIEGGQRRAVDAGLVSDASGMIVEPVLDLLRATLERAAPTPAPSDALVERLAEVAAILLLAGLPRRNILDILDGISPASRRSRRPRKGSGRGAEATRRPQTRTPGGWYADERVGLGHR